MSRKKGKQQEPVIDPRWVIAALVVLAALATGTRLLVPGQGAPTDSKAWSVHMRLDFHSARASSDIALAVPVDSAGARLYSQKLAFNGLKLERSKAKAPAHRIVATASKKGNVILDGDFVIRLLPRANKPRGDKTSLENGLRRLYLGREEGIDPRDPTVSAAMAKIAAEKTKHSGLPGLILDYVRNHVAYSGAQGATSAAAALRSGRGNALGRARAMVALCRAGGFPARVVTGFVLDEDSSEQPQPWVEVYTGGRWQGFDPAKGYEPPLPEAYVAFSRGAPLFQLTGMTLERASYAVRQRQIPADMTNGRRGDPLSILDLSRLPLSAKTVLATLLLLPLGALLNAFVKSVVGVQTYGTFTPALLALAAVFVDWITALVTFIVVAVIGLFGRSLLPGLRLTRSPRLTIVFTLVALAMALAVSLMSYFDLLSGAPVVLLPIVILTTLVDRIYSVSDDRGAAVALVRLFWTAVTAVGCFFILNLENLGEILVSYPELHLITIALVFALALYRGPTLLNYPVLRWLGERKSGG